jgi:hypothetical protein
VSKVRCAAGCLLLRNLLKWDAHAAACQRPLMGGEFGEADGADGSAFAGPEREFIAMKLSSALTQKSDDDAAA